MDFLWHKVSAEEQAKIKKEAKEILDKFSKALEKADKLGEAKGVIREKSMRGEKTPDCDKNFKKLFLKNAPSKDDDFIIAEKGSWK